MSYVDQYAAIFRQAADRQARPSPASRVRRYAPRAGLVAMAAAAAAVAAVMLPGIDLGERAATPAPPDDPLVIAHLAGVRESDVRKEAVCRPPRRSVAGVSSAPVAPATRAALGVLRRPQSVPRRFLRDVRRWSDPRATVMAGSLRLLGRPPRALLYVVRGPFGPFIARDPRRCTELMLAELDRRAASATDEVRAGARAALEQRLAQDLEMIATQVDRVYVSELDLRGRVAGFGGGLDVEQLRRTGTGSSRLVRVRGRQAREVSGLVPDGVHAVEVIARGAGERPWVRRHRVVVRDNFFVVGPFHAASFRVRWLDARGSEIDRG